VDILFHVIEKYTLSTWRNFFVDKFKEIKIKNALIGPNECKDMILTKKCGNHNMQCDKNGCLSQS
jgi:hypothetical protein